MRKGMRRGGARQEIEARGRRGRSAKEVSKRGAEAGPQHAHGRTCSRAAGPLSRQVCRYRGGVRKNWRLRGTATEEDFDALFRGGYTAQVAPMVGLWLAYGWPMVGLWLAYGWPMVDLWLIYDWPMVGLWLIYGLVYGWPMVGLWLAYGWPMVGLWFGLWLAYG